MKSEGIGLHGEDGRSFTSEKAVLDASVIAAHELKSPLALMRQLALELTDDTNTPKQRRIAQQLQLVAERSLRFTSDLTKYRQLQTQLFVVRPINIGELWRDVVDEVTPLYAAHGRQLRIMGHARKPLVSANYDLLRRILLNFVDNALHYSDEQGVVELYAQLVNEKRRVRIGVRDHGPALPMEVWKSIQSNPLRPQPIHARPGSSGLGLKIACDFAAAMNANVGATRHRDGASFYVDIPISKQLSLL